MKKSLLEIILISLFSINLFSADIDKISDSELSYYFYNGENTCLNTLNLFSKLEIKTIPQLRNYFKNAKIGTDMREHELGWVELIKDNRSYTFYKGLEKCINDRYLMIILNLPTVDSNKININNISTEYFNYSWEKSGICNKTNNPQGLKDFLIKQNGTIHGLNKEKGIINVWQGGNNLFTKTMEECLKL